jgi:hypothetical protein
MKDRRMRAGVFRCQETEWVRKILFLGKIFVNLKVLSAKC